MHSRHFIPCPDLGARNWLVNFIRVVRQRPQVYTVPEPLLAAAALAVEAFVEAYAIALDRDTRTTAAVAEKRRCRGVAERACRDLAGMIRVNPAIGDADREEAGLFPRAGKRMPVPPPQTHPVLEFVRALPGKHELRFHDSGSPDSRAKPWGAMYLELHVAVGDGAAQGPEEARSVVLISRSPFQLPFAQEDDAKIATYFGRWWSKRGPGAWAQPVSMRIAA